MSIPVVRNEFDDVVAGIMARTGVSRDRAEHAALANGYRPIEASAGQLAKHSRDTRVLEQKEQHEIVGRFRACGFSVYNLSQARASKQTPGLPDLWCMHTTRPVALWWESKRQVGAKWSDAQIAFAKQCRACGTSYGTGDRFDAERWLIEQGFAFRDRGTFEPIREPIHAT